VTIPNQASTQHGRRCRVPAASRTRRAARVLVGVAIVYLGFALALRANLGTGPFNVLQQGVAARLGISIGRAGWVNGAFFVLAAYSMGQRPGVATITSVAAGGLILDGLLAHLGTPHSFGPRIGMNCAGLVLMSIGGAVYLSAGLGASPVDGVMTALYRAWRGRIPLFAVRTALEGTALFAGWRAGGVVGVGTLVIGAGIGPGLHACLHMLGAAPARPAGNGGGQAPAARHPTAHRPRHSIEKEISGDLPAR
jgi:uncharacterized membrane protein YczE